MAEPIFLYTPDHEGPWFISVAEDANDKHGERLCEVRPSPVDPTTWLITSTNPHEYLAYVRYQRFVSKEQAAWFLWSLRERCREITEKTPLSLVMCRYFEHRSRDLYEEERRLLSQFFRIRCERQQLLEFARQYHLDATEYQCEDSDNALAVRKLKEWKITLQDPDTKEWNEVPFVSEAALYPLLGKEDARTALALIEKLCEAVAPQEA